MTVTSAGSHLIRNVTSVSHQAAASTSVSYQSNQIISATNIATSGSHQWSLQDTSQSTTSAGVNHVTFTITITTTHHITSRGHPVIFSRNYPRVGVDGTTSQNLFTDSIHPPPHPHLPLSRTHLNLRARLHPHAAHLVHT